MRGTIVRFEFPRNSAGKRLIGSRIPRARPMSAGPLAISFWLASPADAPPRASFGRCTCRLVRYLSRHAADQHLYTLPFLILKTNTLVYIRLVFSVAVYYLESRPWLEQLQLQK